MMHRGGLAHKLEWNAIPNQAVSQLIVLAGSSLANSFVEASGALERCLCYGSVTGAQVPKTEAISWILSAFEPLSPPQPGPFGEYRLPLFGRLHGEVAEYYATW